MTRWMLIVATVLATAAACFGSKKGGTRGTNIGSGSDDDLRPSPGSPAAFVR